MSQHEHPNAHESTQGASKKKHDPHYTSIMVAESESLVPSSLPIRFSHCPKSSCGQLRKPPSPTVAFDATGGGNVEVSVKACAEVLKDLEDATQVLGSETGTAEGTHRLRCSGWAPFTWCAHEGEPQRVRSGDDGEASCSRISAVTRVAGEEPFAEVKNSITDSMNRFQSEAASEASHKSYCDDELAKASGERTLKLRCALSSKLETAVSKTNAEDGEVAELHADLGGLSQLRNEEEEQLEEHEDKELKELRNEEKE